MATEDGMPVVNERGEVTFPSAQSIRDALPKLKRGSLTVSGPSPGRGRHSFRVLFPAAGLDVTVQGDVVASVAGRAVVFFPDPPADFIARLEGAAEGRMAPAAWPAGAGRVMDAPPPPALDQDDAAAKTVVAGEDIRAQLAATLKAQPPPPPAAVPRAPAPPLPKAPVPRVPTPAATVRPVVPPVPRAAPPPPDSMDIDVDIDMDTEPPPPAAAQGLGDDLFDMGPPEPGALPPRAAPPPTPSKPPAPRPSVPPAGPGAPGTELDAAGVVPQVLEIAKRARTGTLEVRRGQVVKMVMFHGGRPLDVRSNDPAERLGEVLVTHRRIDRAQQSKALALSQSEGCFFGEALVKLGVLTGQQLTEFLHSQAVVRFNDLLGWTSGTYRFDAAGAVDPAGAVLREGALELCRQFLTPSRGFALDRVTTWLGDTKLALEKGSQWLVGSEAMSPADLKVVRALSSGKPLTFNGLMAELEKAGLKRPEALVAVFLLAAGHVASVTAGVPEPAGDGGGEVSDLASVMATDEADKVLEEIKGRLWGKSIYRILNVGPSTPPDKLDELLDGVHDEVAKLTLGRPETSDARAYLFARIEDLKRHASDPLERSIELRAHVMGVDPSDPATHELLEAECLGNVVAENIARGKFKDVFSHSEREATLRPDDPLAVSHWGLCQALGSDDPKVKKAGAVMLLEAAEKYPKSLDVLCAGVRACAAAGQPGAAKRLLKLAEALAPKDTKVQQAAVALSEVRSAGKAAGAAGGVDAVVVPGAVLKVVGVALGFYALIGVPGVVLNAGSKEYYYTGDDPFWYVRHLLLVVFALLGARVAASEGPKDFFTRLGFAAKPGPLVLALLIGVASGWISPFQNVKGAAGTVIGLTVAHVVAEQLFFNGLLVRTFMGSLSRKSTILMAMAMFAAYHATYVSFIRWQTMEWIPYSLAAVAVGGALPYAALYVYSGSILPPLLCHLACNLTMMGYSLATRGVAVVP